MINIGNISLPDFPLLLVIKIKLLFDIASLYGFNTNDYKERVTYDPNGNIKNYLRNGDAARPAMDDMAYSYKTGTNQLDKVVDAAADASDPDYPNYNDIKRKQPDGSLGQANANYQYDEIGNLISDVSEGITNISWSVYGKIQSIAKSNSSNSK